MNVAAQIFLPLSLAFIMFSMGLGLKVEDFLRVAKFPKAFFIGLLLQMVSLPILGFAVATIWTSMADITPALAVGFMIISACPGGVTSNLFTYMAKGSTALSISLTAIISILSVFTIPFIVNFGLSHFAGSEAVQLPLFKTIVGVFAITTVPVGIGMLIRGLKQDLALRMEPVTAKFASVLFVIIIAAAIIKDREHLVEHFLLIGPATLILNIATMTLAILVARIAQLSLDQSKAITFECGLQNGTLAIMISLTLLGNQEMMIVAGLYSILMFGTGGLYLLWLKRESLLP